MSSDILLHIGGWTLAAIAAGAGAYAFYKYSGSLKKGSNGNASRHDASKEVKSTKDDIDRLCSECWETYVQLQTILTRKEAYRKCLVGETGIETALNKLKSILESGRDDAYMAPRITNQVCGFISNTLIAGGMIGENGSVKMPEPNPSLMERAVYFRNITVSSEKQAEKYRKVADYQRSRIKMESSDTHFADTLRELLPRLKQACNLAEGNIALSPEHTVAWGKDFFDESSQIIAKHEN